MKKQLKKLYNKAFNDNQLELCLRISHLQSELRQAKRIRGK